MVAIAIDGMDIARGVGDPAAWPLTERLAVIGRTGKGKSALEPVRSAVAAKLPAITSNTY